MADDKHKDLAAAAIWALVTLAAVALTDITPVRFVLAVPLVLFIPGHVFLRAIGLLKPSLAAHCVYAVGASIGICLVSGVFLNTIGLLNPIGWSFWLLLVTAGLAFAAARRGSEAGFALPALRVRGFRPIHSALLSIALVMAFGAYAIAAHGTLVYRPFTYTGFWMVPVSRDDPHQLTIGVESTESEAQLFDVQVTLGKRVVALWRSVKVEPGATWLATFRVGSGSGTLQKLEARLYRPGDNEIYRRVSAVVPGN